MDRVALITGITGQDGSYLAELLLEKGYRVHGIVRRIALESPETRLTRIAHLLDRIELHTASLESFASLHRVLGLVRPDECYHLAASSFVSYSFDEDEFAMLNANIVMARDRLLSEVWGFDYEGESRTVDMHIKTLRQKLGDAGKYIKTIRSVGYMIGD